MEEASVLTPPPQLGDPHAHEDVRGSDAAAFVEVLRDAVHALDEDGIDYLVMGGLVTSSLGPPRWTHDIDLFVPAKLAKAALESLGRHGFRTEETDPWWLYKAFRHDVMIDVIFRSSGDVFLDEEMLARAQPREIGGVLVRVISPEDLIVIKALATSAASPRHWHDALGIIAACDLDWSYLVERGHRRGVRRLLSLLLFAQSEDLYVPSSAIRTLAHAVLDE